jgi:hypothetical protein
MSESTPKPKRALSTNFTEQTMRRSIMAKKRDIRRSQLRELFSMKNTRFIKQPIGALIAIALIITGGVGVYAAVNWFNGDIKVASDRSIMTVDLTQCKTLSLPGIEPGAKEAQFKILDERHISAEDLQKRLLAQCELDTARERFDATTNYQSSIIKAITPYQVTLETFWNGQVTDKVFSISKDTNFYDKGTPARETDMRVGDTVLFAYERSELAIETQNPLDGITTVKSIFKTQYDTKKAASTQKAFYEDNHIMPIDMYNSQKH